MMMPLFEWTAIYDVGVPNMNCEHKTLIGIMNELHGATESKAPRSRIRRLLAELAEYTTFHFENEERFMQDLGFDGLDKHRRIHADLLERVQFHKQRFDAGEADLEPAFFSFLKLWLAAHMRGIDKQYSPAASARA